jgi:hypothetical protein
MVYLSIVYGFNSPCCDNRCDIQQIPYHDDLSPDTVPVQEHFLRKDRWTGVFAVSEKNGAHGIQPEPLIPKEEDATFLLQ